MKRKKYKELLNWKISKTRKPLILQGARQVGKSYLLNEFGKNEFENVHIFNFEKDVDLKLIFSNNLSPVKIIQDLSIKANKKINTKTDLIIFDEIQECPRAMTSLKYFHEEMPDLYLCCAGSLLGINPSRESFRSAGGHGCIRGAGRGILRALHRGCLPVTWSTTR